MTLVFTITEALIGRLLVKHGLVDDSQSIYRLVVMPLHLVNTSLLLCSEVMTAENIRFSHQPGVTQLNAQPKQRSSLTISLVIFLCLLLTSGAIAALGSHLMPSESLLQGLRHDLARDAHSAVRLRVLHPILGLLLPMAFWLLINHDSRHNESNQDLISTQKHLLIALFATVMIGTATLGFLAPVWLKLCHLTAANLVVITAARFVYYRTGVHRNPGKHCSILP
jgi:heme A synthase